MFRRAASVAALTFSLVVCGVAASGEAQAWPGYGFCPYPGVGVQAVGFGYCDYPTEADGAHWHCEWGWLGIGSCSFRWPDNTFAY